VFFVVFCGLAKIGKGERQQTTSLTNNREEKYSMKKKIKKR
jgi:peroxiredoxin family protein